MKHINVFDVKKLCTQCMNVFRVDLTINSGYILEEYEPV